MITALLIFFALVLEYIYDPISNMKDTVVIDNVFRKFSTLVKNYITKKYHQYLLFPIVIMIVLAILLSILENYIHYFFSFIVSMIILVYCMKPNEFNQMVEDLKFSIDSKNEFNKSDRYNYIMMEQNKIDDKKSINNIFYNSTRSIFTVLFCFLLLGPIGCLGYVILDNYLFSKSIKVDIKSKKEIKNIIAVIEYIPIRLCSFSFAVVANFEQCIKAWKARKVEKDLYTTNIALVNDIGISSYKDNDNDVEKISYIQSIISRSFLAWLSLIGFFIISGFFI